MPFPSFPRAGKLKRRENSDHLAGHHGLQMQQGEQNKTIQRGSYPNPAGPGGTKWRLNKQSSMTTNSTSAPGSPVNH